MWEILTQHLFSSTILSWHNSISTSALPPGVGKSSDRAKVTQKTRLPFNHLNSSGKVSTVNGFQETWEAIPSVPRFGLVRRHFQIEHPSPSLLPSLDTAFEALSLSLKFCKIVQLIGIITSLSWLLATAKSIYKKQMLPKASIFKVWFKRQQQQHLPGAS